MTSSPPFVVSDPLAPHQVQRLRCELSAIPKLRKLPSGQLNVVIRELIDNLPFASNSACSAGFNVRTGKGRGNSPRLSTQSVLIDSVRALEHATGSRQALWSNGLGQESAAVAIARVAIGVIEDLPGIYYGDLRRQILRAEAILAHPGSHLP
jgi:hypothetical protein